MQRSVFLLIFLFVSACASGPSLQRTVHQEETLLVVLDQNPVPAQPEFETPYSHPARIAAADLEQILGSIKINPDKGMLMAFFSEKEEKELFHPTTISHVATQLSEALQNATPEERVNFYQMTPLNASNVSATTGYLLVKDDQLHVRVDQYRVPLRKGSHPARAGMNIRPTEKSKYAFSVAESGGMTHRSFKNVLGFDSSDPHWLVIDYANFPDPDANETNAGPVAPEKTPQKSLEERLRTLKHLRDEGLITEEEYEQKKQSLLEDL